MDVFYIFEAENLNSSNLQKNDKKMKSQKNYFQSMLWGGPVGMGSMGSAEPINFERRVLEPINFLDNSIEIHILTLNGTEIINLQKRL